jgi:hypothetical protein
MAGTTQEVFWLGERIQMARSWCVVAAHNKTKKKKQQMLFSSDVGSYCLRSSDPINYYPTELVRRKQSDKSSFFSSSSKLRLRMMSSTSRHHQPTSAAMLGAEKNLLQSKISGGVQEGHKASAQRVALRVALICGGPSAERGISLNSARSVLDHLKSEDVVVQCYYLNQDLQPFAISAAQVRRTWTFSFFSPVVVIRMMLLPCPINKRPLMGDGYSVVGWQPNLVLCILGMSVP